MSTTGITKISIALMDRYGYLLTGDQGIFKYTDKASTDTTGIFSVDETTSKGVSSIDISGLGGSNNDVLIDNKLVRKMATKTSPQSTLVINSLPYEIKSAFLGLPLDDIGGFPILGSGQNDNYVAILAQTTDAFANKPLYVGLYMGNVSEQSLSFQTNNDAVTYNVDTYIIDHVERDRGFGRYYYSGMSNFNEQKMFSDVFYVKS